MNNKSKQGITMTSLVVYVVIFSGLTVLLSIIYTNMNETLFFNRGRAINYTAFNELQYNITASTLQSTNITKDDNSVTYSNGDKYLYDTSKGIILLNGGILCTNVTRFTPSIIEENGVKQLKLEITFNKYLNELNKEIVSSVEVN